MYPFFKFLKLGGKLQVIFRDHIEMNLARALCTLFETYPLLAYFENLRCLYFKFWFGYLLFSCRNPNLQSFRPSFWPFDLSRCLNTCCRLNWCILLLNWLKLGEPFLYTIDSRGSCEVCRGAHVWVSTHWWKGCLIRPIGKYVKNWSERPWVTAGAAAGDC